MKVRSVQVTGLKDIMRRLVKLGPAADLAVKNGVYLSAQECRRHAIASIQERSQGREVQRIRQGGGGTYSHIASRPGDAPNTDTGNLVKNIAVEKISDTEYDVGVGEAAAYGRDLEFGTQRMEARPWLGPAAERTDLRRNMEQSINIEINRAVKS